MMEYHHCVCVRPGT